MIQLGISAFYHDSAAALLIDGKVIFAIEEEKLSGIKHDNSFPLKAIEACLSYAQITIDEVDILCWYEVPNIKYDRVSKTLGKRWIKYFKTWNKFKKEFKATEGNLKKYIKDAIGYDGVITFTKHHLSHLALSFYTSPFDEAIGISIDGVGEWDTISIAECNSNGIIEIKNVKFPNSLGLVYSTITSYLGFKPNSGEYKVMGLAPYGDSSKYNELFDTFASLDTVNLVNINQKYFTWEYSNTDMFTLDLVKLIGFEPRQPESKLEQHHMDLAASLQRWYERCLYYIINNSSSYSGNSNLVLGGGCAYNGTANGKIKKHCGIKNVWIPYAPSDAGSAIGACLYVWHDVIGNNKIKGGDNQSPYLGPEFSKEYVLDIIDRIGDISFKYYKNTDTLLSKTAELIKEGNIIGWFQGRTEFGARALGNRSILANPHLSDVRDRINKVVKKREMFRPFAPSVTHEDYQKYFKSEEDVPYMNQVVQVISETPIPSVTHVDNSARIQTVTNEQNPLYYSLLKEFEKVSGTPILLNTSFNLRGQTMVNDPYTAVTTFKNCDMDYLVIGNYIISKIS
jgi:carbamoyltransferase